MILNEQNREFAMELLCAMTIEDLAAEFLTDQNAIYREFRRSNTFSVLFDPETGLWLNGPEYVAGEYKAETGGGSLSP